MDGLFCLVWGVGFVEGLDCRVTLRVSRNDRKGIFGALAVGAMGKCTQAGAPKPQVLPYGMEGGISCNAV